jgi:hypothetical protein
VCGTASPGSGMRETNPIWPGSGGLGPRRAKDAKRSQSPATPGGTRPEGRGTRGKRAKRTQLPEAGHRGGVPIADFGLRTGADARRNACPAAYRLRPAQANRAKRTRFRAVRPGLRRPNCAKQSQTWAGWDIWGTACQRKGDRAKQSQFTPARPEVGARPGPGGPAGVPLCKTNPIWRADCAKRTQFPLAQPPRQPIFPGFQPPAGDGKAIVRNEPNFRSQADTGEPASPSAARRTRSPEGARFLWSGKDPAGNLVPMGEHHGPTGSTGDSHKWRFHHGC